MGDRPVADATELALAAATHLTDMDKGAVEALRMLAVKIDTDDALREAYLDYAAEHDKERRPLQLDNVSIPTYLKYCESLGLTPAGRVKLGDKGKQGDRSPSALGQLRAVHGTQASTRGAAKG